MQLIIAIVVAALIYILQSRLYERLWDYHLEVQLQFDKEEAQIGDSVHLIEIIQNRKWLPLPVLHLKYSCSKSFHFTDMDNSYITDSFHRNDVFSVMGNQKITRNLEFQPTKRGYYILQNANILSRDFFLIKRFAKKIAVSDAIYVLPKPFEKMQLELFFNQLMGDFLYRNSMFQDPFSFQGIREYSRFDSMRDINWKATAHNQQLMVHVYDKTMDQQIRILLNLETNNMIHTEYMREVCIRIVSLLSHELLQQHIAVSFVSNGSDILTKENLRIEEGSDFGHIKTIDRCLARIDQNMGMDIFLQLVEDEIHKPNSNVTYLIVSSYYKDNLLNAFDQMLERGKNVYMICPYYSIDSVPDKRSYITSVPISIHDVTN